MAQKKVYFEPYLGFYVGNYKPVDSVNKKQDIIKTNTYGGKLFGIGGRLTYIDNNMVVSAGAESSHFSSGFKHIEPPVYPKVDSYESLGQDNCKSFYVQLGYHITDINIKKPRWMGKNKELPYLMVSKITPFIGFEFWMMTNSFRNDEISYQSSISTSSGSISGSNQFHSYTNTHYGIRTGIDWVFYNREKRRFIIMLLYKIGFKDAGYFLYKFNGTSFSNAFDFQTTTKGSGFCIYAGVPIKLFQLKKKETSRIN
jgi:hypothetical protein